MTDKQTATALLKLIEIMATLRSPHGCPWDQQQTPETLKPYILEETYELIEAIDNNDTFEIRDELGDLLLQVVFMAQMFSEQNKFGLAEVAESISNKLIRRHPHVFGNANADDHAARWQKIKQQERAAKGKGNKLADRIPANLPALKKAAKVAKSLDNNLQTIEVDKIHDILRQLSLVTADPIGSKNDLDKLFGNLLFGVVQLGNSLQLDAEDLLRKKTIEVIAEIDN